MYDESHFTRDAAIVRFDGDAAGVTVDDDGEPSFDWDEVERVTVENPPHAEAFDSKEFYRIPATVAKPIPQPYQYGEDTVWLKKPRDELKKAAWSLDNAPWTLGHPDSGMVKDVDDVHGFWKNPRYIDSLDDLDADLHVPVHDEDAKDFLEENSDVSVGFYNRIARTDEYDGIVGGDDAEGVEIEGYQTSMLFDHCASVGVGRCPSEAGCGIDAANHGHITSLDGTHSGGMTSLMSEESGGPTSLEEKFSEGDMVVWQANESMWGRVVAIDPEKDILMVELMRMEDGEAVPVGTTVTAGYSDLMLMEETDEAFKKGTRITDTSDEADGAVSDMQATTDQPEGIHVADGMWFAVGPDEHPDGSTDWPDDAKFPVDSCADITDAWNLRGTGDISISEETLEARIRRAADAKDCDLPETAQMGEDAAPAPEAVAASAKRYSVCGARKEVMEDRDCGTCTEPNEDTSDTDMEIEFDDLSTEAALAKVAAQHDGVEERLDALREAEETAEVARDAADELDLDDTSDLTDKVALLKEDNDNLREQVDELQRPQMEEDAKFIAERTDRFGEDAEEVIDNLDADPEKVADKRELVDDLTEGYDEQTANSGGGSEGGNSKTRTGKYAKTPWN